MSANVTIVAEPVVHAVDMSADQWKKAFKQSDVYRAWIGIISNNDVSVKRAPKPALSLKQNLCPEFEIQDHSHIDVRETSSRIETELTAKAFSDSGINASLAGGANGLTLGIGGDINWRKEMTSSSENAQEASKIHCSYNFPRVLVHLNKSSMELSEECKTFILRKMEQRLNPTQEDLESFFHEFGGMFAQRVCLGGRLYSVESVTGMTEAQKLERKNEMKVGITGKFMTPFGGLSIGGHRGSGTETSQTIVVSSQARSASIEAQGGNSLVSWSPPDWAISVGSYNYWRAIGQEGVTPLLPVLNGIATGETFKKYLKALNELLETRTRIPEQPQEQVMRFEIGNTHSYFRRWERLSSNSHLWTFFVRPSRPNILSKIEVVLDESFDQSDYSYDRDLDEVLIQAAGWGTFAIQTYFTLKDEWKWQDDSGEILPGQRRQTDWMLNFDQPMTSEMRSFTFVHSAAGH